MSMVSGSLSFWRDLVVLLLPRIVPVVATVGGIGTDSDGFDLQPLVVEVGGFGIPVLNGFGDSVHPQNLVD